MKTESATSLHTALRHLPLAGRYWALAALVLLLFGLFKGINLLTLLAWLMLTLLLGNMLVAGRRLGHLLGQQRISGPIFAGLPVRLEITVTNPQGRSQPGLLLENQSPLGTQRWFVPRLAGRGSQRFQEAIVLPRRGRYPWGALVARSSDPFGLYERNALLEPPQELIVLPRIGRLHRGGLKRFLTSAGITSPLVRSGPRRNPSAQAEFHGLRAFRSGDSPRWIHWRTSARCGELMIREFEDLPTDNLVLVVDLCQAPASGIWERASLLEAAVSLAASVCWEWCRQKGDRFVLAVPGPEPVVLHGITGDEFAYRMLECLAVQEEYARAEISGLVSRLPSESLPAAPVLVVSPYPGGLRQELARRWHRPVAALEATMLKDVDFYEPPDSSSV
jgi:uncharacterized protein (DUF58 family)